MNYRDYIAVNVLFALFTHFNSAFVWWSNNRAALIKAQHLTEMSLNPQTRLASGAAEQRQRRWSVTEVWRSQSISLFLSASNNLLRLQINYYFCGYLLWKESNTIIKALLHIFIFTLGFCAGYNHPALMKALSNPNNLVRRHCSVFIVLKCL